MQRSQGSLSGSHVKFTTMLKNLAFTNLVAISNRKVSVALRKMRKAPAEASKLADTQLQCQSNCFALRSFCVLYSPSEVRDDGTVFFY